MGFVTYEGVSVGVFALSLIQLLEGASAQQREALGIMTPDYFYYLNQSGTYKVDGTIDSKDFQETMVKLLF